MGLLDKFKKRKETAEPATGQQKEQVFQQDLSKEADSLIRPGGVFMVQLLMKERCEMPSNERLIQVLSKHLGNVEQFGSKFCRSRLHCQIQGCQHARNADDLRLR